MKKIAQLTLVLLLFYGVWGMSTIQAQENNKAVTLEYIAHASFKITYNGTTLLLDPYADKIWLGYNFPKDIKADAIFSTHPHYDHDGGLYLKQIPYWKDKIPFYQDPGRYAIASFGIQGFQGKHCDPYGKEFGQKNTLWKIEVAGLTIVHLGDNGPLTPQNYKDLGPIDILLIPIDSQYHILKKEELAIVLETIDPKIIIPMHYRIPELETEIDAPKDLGEITPWLQGKDNVKQLNGNTHSFAKKDLPKKTEIVVFKHSKNVTH